MSLFDPSLPSIPDSSLDKQRLMLLLAKLSPSRTTLPSEWKKKFDNQLAASLGLSPALALSSLPSLTGRGWVEQTSSKLRRTQHGTQLLDQYRIYLPDLLSRSRAQPPVDAHEEATRRSYLLMQLFLASGRTMPLTEANKPNTHWEALRLNPATARALRIQLFEERRLSWEPNGSREKYSVTQRGLAYLAGLPFLPGKEFRIKGDPLEELLRAARKGPVDEPAETVPTNRPVPVDLRVAILQAFEQLKHDEYHRSGVVPIHRVRAAVRERLGAELASHDSFDVVIKRLRTEGKFRLIAITDISSATRQQLDDSIPGFRETLFDMEANP